MMRYDVVRAVMLETVCDVLGSAIFELHGKRKYGRKLFERSNLYCNSLIKLRHVRECKSRAKEVPDRVWRESSERVGNVGCVNKR
jgi:hypothetical protein